MLCLMTLCSAIATSLFARRLCASVPAAGPAALSRCFAIAQQTLSAATLVQMAAAAANFDHSATTNSNAHATLGWAAFATAGAGALFAGVSSSIVMRYVSRYRWPLRVSGRQMRLAGTLSWAVALPLSLAASFLSIYLLVLQIMDCQQQGFGTGAGENRPVYIVNSNNTTNTTTTTTTATTTTTTTTSSLPPNPDPMCHGAIGPLMAAVPAFMMALTTCFLSATTPLVAIYIRRALQALRSGASSGNQNAFLSSSNNADR